VKSIFLLEPQSQGHRMLYPRRIAREAIKWGYQITIATFKESCDSTIFKAIHEEFGENIKTLFLPHANFLVKRKRKIIQEIGYYLLFKKLFKNLPQKDRPDFVFVPFVDYCSRIIAIFGSPFGTLPWAGLVMSPEFHFRSMLQYSFKTNFNAIRKFIFLKLINGKRLVFLCTIDELLKEFIKRVSPEASKKLMYVPDPADIKSKWTKSTARHRLKISTQSKVVLVYGYLSLRKGIQTLIEATRNCNGPSTVALLFAGEQDNEVRRLLSTKEAVSLKNNHTLYEINRFLSDEEEALVFSASDIVWVGYRNFNQMSGVLIQAGKMALPVIACREGLIGWMVNKYNLGIVVDSNNVQEITTAINSLCSNPGLSSSFGSHGAHLAKNHTSSLFSSRIFDAIDAATTAHAAPVTITSINKK
jgi:glycosyltransferase involved in cell wall biosynthesis